jgi:hypothetical protein
MEVVFAVKDDGGKEFNPYGWEEEKDLEDSSSFFRYSNGNTQFPAVIGNPN